MAPTNTFYLLRFSKKFAQTGLASLLMLFFAYELSAQGVQVQKPKLTTSAPFGFYEYLPIGYDTETTKRFPVLLCLHGQGELGNGTTELYKAIVHGPGKEIAKGRHLPFIVITPQSLYWWNATLIDNMVEYIKKTYRVDETRFYLTGLSMGGIAAWEYTAKFPDKIAAMVPIAGNGNAHDPLPLSKVPIWAFHGTADKTVDPYGSINIVNAINNLTPKPDPQAKLTLYSGVAHDSWTRTYDGSAGHDIYSWMLSYSKNGTSNVAPTAQAGSDRNIQLPINSIVINGSGTDTDGSIVNYAWVKVTGPSANLANQNTANLTASNLVAGTYVFRLTVTDNIGASGSDDMTLIVTPQAVNQSPTANAGIDQTITLPINTVLLTGTGSDPDGSIASYSWVRLSGPTATISDATKAQITVNNLLEGTYVFRLTVTDDKGATGTDDVTVIVNAAAVNQIPTVTIGPDRIVNLPQSVIVIGGAASDTDGSIATYEWSKRSGPDAVLENATTSEVTISDLVEGVYIFRLTVTDNEGASAYAEIQITVLGPVNQIPVANAGPDRQVTLPTNTINITGSGSDADGGILIYQWEKVSGPACDLVNSNTAILTVDNLVEGVYTFSLTVTDDKEATDVDEMTVTVLPASVNQPPTVNAGNNRNVTLPLDFIDISAVAQDLDGTIQTYQWIKVSGADITITNDNTATIRISDLVPGNFVLRVTVTDNQGAEASDDVEIVVSPEIVNQAPSVTASEDVILTLPINTTVLTALASDIDGTIASFNWIKVSGPTATLVRTDTAFLPLEDLVQGIYVFRVTVEDDDGASASDEVTVTVKPSNIQSCNCDHVIEANVEYIKAMDMPKPVKPGDVICVRAGTRGYIRFMDFVGTPEAPLTFINCGGQVIINNPTTDGSLSFTRCKYFRVTGTGDPNYTYGFKIAVSTKNTAMFLGDSDFEVDHVEIANAGYAGIMAKIDPLCENSQYHRGNFVMQNIKLHDNYIHDVNGEGFYIGYYAYGGIDKAPCGMIYPHDIKNIKIYNNIIKNTAADGIQVTCAVEGCEIYGNTVENYGLNPFSSDQNNGIIIGGGTSGLCYNNFIRKGTGVGLAVFGLGDNIIYNNIIAETQSYGVFFGIGSTIPGKGFSFINNTIINTKLDGIRFQNEVSRGNKFYNNIIVNPGTYDTYENGGFCAKGKDSYFYSNCSIGMDYDSANNYCTRNIANVRFVDPVNYDFRLRDNSPAVDRGRNVASFGITFDFHRLTRPSNALYDIGACEYQNDGSTNRIPSIVMPANQIIVLPTNATTLTASATDEDGVIASYAWSQSSGPSPAELSNDDTPTLTVKNLIEGEYIFRLTVTDDGGGVAYKEVKVTVRSQSVNQAPIANAGSNRTITLPTNSIVLNGIGSDTDGTVVSYQWVKVSGPTATLANATTANLSLTQLVAGIYVFRLTVTDNVGAQGSAQMTLTVQPQVVNKPPVANAGGDKILTLPNNSIVLNGSGSDPDGSIASYQWTKQSGPAANLGTTTTPNLSLTGLVEGVYIFRLTVRDNQNATAFADAKVTVLAQTTPKPPIANAGTDIIITLPTNSATLNGSATAEGSITDYTWSKRSGPTVTLGNTKNASLQVTNLVEGQYVFRLTVTDNNGATAFDEVVITVLPQAINKAPVANAGGNKSIKLPTSSVALQGSGSDQDGSIVEYSWSQVSGVAASLSDVALPSLTVSGLNVGVYTFRLTVKDDKGATDFDEAIVTVVETAANTPPVAYAGNDVILYLPINNATLSGNGVDNDGTIASYLWTKLSGPLATMGDLTHPDLTLSNLVEGNYAFQLTVTDNQGASSTDRVNVTVLPENVNQAPVAAAGPDINIRLPQSEQIIQGSGSDPDGQIVSYLWVKKSGPDVTISDVNAQNIRLTNLQPGGYVFELIVTDNKNETATDEMQLFVLPAREGPQVFAGSDTTVNLPVNALVLRGFGSILEGSIESYLWQKVSGPDVTLTNFDTPVLELTNLTIGEYLFTLTVTDDKGLTASDDVIVYAIELLNAPKVFTPNGDGTNDFWQVGNLDLVQSCPLVIFDQYGNKVFETNSYNNDWDGQFRGQQLAEGPYYYVFQCSETGTLTGGVRIIR